MSDQTYRRVQATAQAVTALRAVRSRKTQKPLDFGLFGGVQLDIVDHIRGSN